MSPHAIARHQLFKSIVTELGCRMENRCRGPECTEENWLEFWSVPGKGMMIAQLREAGGVATYVDWPAGYTWDDLSECLKHHDKEHRQEDDEHAALELVVEAAEQTKKFLCESYQSAKPIPMADTVTCYGKLASALGILAEARKAKQSG